VLRNLSILLILTSMASPTLAAEGHFQISPRLGRGEMRIDEGFTIADEREEVDALSVGVAAGYSTPFGLLLEVGAASQSNFDWWSTTDEFSLSQQYVAIGYEIDFAEGWTFTPKAGRARWKLHSEEGLLFNPGPEAEKDTRGYEYFWEAQLSRRLNDRVSLGGAYREGEFDFGRARSVSFVATLTF
jgi:hypothetical protein